MSEVADISQAQVILASQSTSRRTYMEQLGVPFFVMPADIPEPLPQHIPPEENAQQLAFKKARAVAKRIRQLDPHLDAIIIASDTIATTSAGRQLAKAEDTLEARSMLSEMLGNIARNTTAVALIDLATGEEESAVAVTEVHFRAIDEPGVTDALETYLASEDWRDKAGAYGIQSGAAPLIRGIRGEYSTIVGLPIIETREMLARHGIATHEVVDEIPDGVERLG